MASTKISALASGTTAATSDAFVVARAGNNKKLTTAQVFTETLTLAAFTTLQTSDLLVPERTYRVTGCGAAANLTLHVTASDLNSYYLQTALEHNLGTVQAWFHDAKLDEDPEVLVDAHGNQYDGYYAAAVGDRVTLNLPTVRGCRFEYPQLEVFNPNAHAQLKECAFLGANVLNFKNLTAQGSRFSNVSLNNPKNDYVFVVNSNLRDSTVTVDGDGTYGCYLTDCDFKNATLALDSGDDVQLTHCRFENCQVNISGGVNVVGLTILGRSYGDGVPSYTIDGAYQSAVVDNWSGTVVADARGLGSSNVAMKVAWNNAGGLGTWGYSGSAASVRLPLDSPIGIFELEEFTGSSVTKSFPGPENAERYPFHKVRLKWRTNSGKNTLKFNFATTEGALNLDNETLSYHGVTNKVGELLSVNAWVDLQAVNSLAPSGKSWALVYGTHYDL